MPFVSLRIALILRLYLIVLGIMRHMVYQIKIHKGELWNPEKTSEAKALRVLSGKAWVTVTGTENDIIVGEGELLPYPQTGLLIESLTQELVLEGRLD